MTTPLVFTCKNPCPYFDTVAGYVSFYPASEDLINQLGIDGFRYATQLEMWYCGPYLIEEYVNRNTKSFIPNPTWYGADDHSRFERVVVTMLTDQVVGYQLYQNRELDEIDLTESTITTITNDPNHEYADQLCEKRPKKYSYQFHFNFERFNDDGTPDDNWNKAVANEAFRRCMLEGLDLTTYYARTNAINPLKCENDFYTMQGVCYNTSGKDYTELVREKMGYGQYDGETMVPYPWRRHRRPQAAGDGRAERHRRHLPRPLLLSHSVRQHHPAGQRRRAASVLHRQPGRTTLSSWMLSSTSPPSPRRSSTPTSTASCRTAGALTSAIPSTSWARRSCTTTTPTTP